MKVGQFTLEILHADTKQPMREFRAPDGKVYVEAEPDLEYFLRCSSEFRGDSPENCVGVDFFVDGTLDPLDATIFGDSRVTPGAFSL